MAITSTKNVHSEALIKTYIAVADIWKLTMAEQAAILGLAENSAIYTSWRNIPSSANLDKEKTMKLTLILAIYKELQTRYPQPDQVQNWLRTAITEAPFAGLTPVDLLKKGKTADTLLVRQYLTEGKTA